MTAPVALSCGEPAGVGPELAARAWTELGETLPFFYLGDPSHLPAGANWAEIADPSETARACATGLPVLRHVFKGQLTPGTPNPAHAQGVIDVIAQGVDLVQSGKASALCTAPIHKQALQDGGRFCLSRPYGVSGGSGWR